MPSTASTVTPAMRQYLDAKRQHPEAIVFFRMGDFYEMFYEDALVAARTLDLTLTSRSKDAAGNGIPMCGLPFHALEGYLAKLVGKGFRVAICEQIEDPKKAKGLVKRAVVRVVSPGTLTDANYLEAREPAYLMGLVEANDIVGAALIDLSTGEFTVAEYAGLAGLQALTDEITVLRPREIVLPSDSGIGAKIPEITQLQIPVSSAEPWAFEPQAAEQALLKQLKVHGLEGFGLRGRLAAVQAGGGLLGYLSGTQQAAIDHIRSVSYKTGTDGLIIDPVTLKHLEVLIGSEGTPKGSLLHNIDRSVTAMGGRMLRGWLLRPLCEIGRIRDRLDAVEELGFRSIDRAKFREALKSVHDLERLVARAALGTVGPRDFVSLGQSLRIVPRIRTMLADVQAPLLRSLIAELDDLVDVRDRIERSLIDEPPAVARDGGFTRDGLDAGLDDLKRISRSGRQIIADMEERERSRTGISSLKVRFNRVFGYYIEVSKSNLHAVPSDYQRKQTVANGERFTTPALKEHEATILGADERILERELQIFEALRVYVAGEAIRVQATARVLATLDVVAALAETAAVSNFTKPHMHEADELVAADARHPVVEHYADGAFVPNDIDLNGSSKQLVVLTGPNMGGKSTYLRQVALLPVLAQIGSFVPARDAKLPIIDRIFARVGASDNIARGQSTFMVEMQETANILHTASSRSLVVLDEIGRGTSTFDGLSLAWAIAEHLATHVNVRPKTLFATHYHELTDLADVLPGVVNAHVAAREWKDEIVFLRKIMPGRSDRSYGIQVARLAGLPAAVTTRAKEILNGLERDELSRGGRPTLSGAVGDPRNSQLGLFVKPSDKGHDDVTTDATNRQTSVMRSPVGRQEHEDTLTSRLVATNLDEITPRQALDLLADLKDLAEDE